MRDYMLVIDGSSLLSTQYYGNMPNSIKFESDESKRRAMYNQLLHTSDGRYTNGVYGFFRYLFNVLRNQKPSHLAIAWDLSRNTFRKDIYPEYKGTRKDTPEPLKQQFATCQDVIEKMGITQFRDERYEADDFCGSIARRFEKELPVRILTKDKDYFQLITDSTNIFFLLSSKDKVLDLFNKYDMDIQKYNFPDKTFRFNRKVLFDEYGYTPETAVTVKALAGDPSDNIKGVPGIGEDVAIKLAQEYKTVEALYAAVEGLSKQQTSDLKQHWKDIGIKRAPLTPLLKESDTELVGKKSALLSQKLATIKTDIDLDEYFFFGASLDEFKVSIDPVRAKEILAELEIKSIDTN